MEWLKGGEGEEKWVWMGRGGMDMEMGERWGLLYVWDKVVGKGSDWLKYG